MSDEVEAGGGSFSLDDRPYWRPVLDAFDDSEVESIVVRKSTQVGGTMTLIAHMLYKACHAPAPSMVVLPDRDSAVEFRDRVYMDALESPSTRHLVPPKRDWNTRYIDLRTMRVYLAWSGSAQRTRMKACQTIYLSEVDVFNSAPGKRGGDPNRAAEERGKSFLEKKVYRESSPTAEPSVIAGEYAGSNQGNWMCPCPHCGTYQRLNFFTPKVGEQAGKGGMAGYIDDNGAVVDPETAERDAHYVCQTGCRIEQRDKDAMIRAGVYCPRGQTVDIDGNLQGEPEMDRRSVGIYVWSIHSPTITLGQIARAYVNHHRSDNLEDFLTNWVGIEFAARRKMPTWKQLGTRLRAEYDAGEVWPASWFCTTGIDVQADLCKWATFSWGDRCTSWAVEWGVCYRDLDAELAHNLQVASDLHQLIECVLKRMWPICGGRVNRMNRRHVAAKLVGIDANHRTTDVHQFLRHVNDPRLRAVRGDHNVDPREKYRPTVVDRNTRTGTPYPGGLKLWGIYVTTFKSDLVERMTRKAGDPGAWHVPRDAIDKGRAFLEEVTNEPPKTRRNKAGRRQLVFEPKSSTIPVDFWDCAVYARALAEMVVDGLPGRPGWDASQWPPPIEGTQQSVRSNPIVNPR